MVNNKNFLLQSRTLLILLIALVMPTIQNIAGQQHTLHDQMTLENEVPSASPKIYYVYKNGEFKETDLSKKPELIGGEELMETLIGLNIRYPEMAKAKKIGGQVIIRIVVDEEGSIEDAFVHQGIGGGCNDEALRAVRLMDKVGFEPGEINGDPVTVMFEIPITFLPK